MPQIPVWINKKTEAYLENRSLDGESLASTAGRVLKEIAETSEVDKI
jgi:hypothetical protein